MTELQSAIKSRNIEKAKELIEAGADVNVQDNRGSTPLHSCPPLSLVKLLLEHGADVHVKDYMGEEPLLKCLSVDALELYIQHGANIHAKNTAGQTLLHKIPSLKVCEFLLQQGLDCNVKDNKGYTPLMYFCLISEAISMQLNGDIENSPIGLLLKSGANINEKNNDGFTALHIAVQYGGIDTISYLLQHSADIQAKTNLGKTVLHLAAEKNSLECFELLLQHNVDMVEKDTEGNTVLHSAVSSKNRNDSSLLQFLISKGLDVNAQNNRGETPLFRLFQSINMQFIKAHLSEVKLLLEQKADPSIETKEGNTILPTAFSLFSEALNNQECDGIDEVEEIITLLFNYGAKLGSGDVFLDPNGIWGDEQLEQWMVLYPQLFLWKNGWFSRPKCY